MKEPVWWKKKSKGSAEGVRHVGSWEYKGILRTGCEGGEGGGSEDQGSGGVEHTCTTSSQLEA